MLLKVNYNTNCIKAFLRNDCYETVLTICVAKLSSVSINSRTFVGVWFYYLHVILTNARSKVIYFFWKGEAIFLKTNERNNKNKQWPITSYKMYINFRPSNERNVHCWWPLWGWKDVFTPGNNWEGGDIVLL